MGRRATYKIEEYANRVKAFISLSQPVETEIIMVEVKGTRHRVFEGFLYLLMTNEITADIVNNRTKMLWSINNTED